MVARTPRDDSAIRAAAARLFPHFVACELMAVGDDCAPVYPDEVHAVAGTAAVRRREFACGRACAHRALRALGAPDRPILTGAHREPLWPMGFVGAIAHSRTLAGACAAATRDASGLGLDIEAVSTTLDPGQRRLLLTEAELAHIASLEHDLPAALVAFSAKETVFKALYPLTGVALEFLDVQVALDIDDRCFTATTAARTEARSIAFAPLAGRFDVVSGHVMTAVTLPLGAAAASAPSQ